MHTKNIFILVCTILGLFSQVGMGQNSDAMIQSLLEAKEFNVKTTQFTITSEHLSSTSKVHHIYYQQQVDGIIMRGTESSAHFGPSGALLFDNNRFVANASEIRNSMSSRQLSPIQAVQTVVNQWQYQLKQPLTIIKDEKTLDHKVVLSSSGISQREIPVKKVLTPDEDGTYRLAWDISILELDFAHWWNIQVDAETGAILSQQNRILNCSFETEEPTNETPNFNKNLVDFPNYKAENSIDAAICENCYEVFALPIQSPYYGERSIVESPWHPVASPFGWHDTDGQPDPESRFTEGNNINAFEANDNFGFQPFGGDRLDFTGYSFNQFYSHSSQYESAAITNLFYWGNTLHDVFYVYGFTESAGNFQFNNYGRGGMGEDLVRVQGQRNITGNCGAFYGATDDGESPIMVLGTCGNKDGSYDSVVIAHEYGHGVTSRLVGGPFTIDCLTNDEQMTEGWCDWFGTILTIQAGDLGEDNRQIGNYYFNKPIDRNGVRRFPYTTNMNVNPHTYASISSSQIPHGVGSVWANMLWEMTWELIDAHGFDPDVFNFTGDINQDAGNVVALAIVMEALKFTRCQPGFVSARDAILQADRAIYNGYNQCFIWNAFAKRGLGLYAVEGNPDNNSDGSENFEGYIDHAVLELSENKFCLENGVVPNIRGGIPAGGFYSGIGVIDDGNGISFSLDLVNAGIGLTEIFYEIPDSQCANQSSDSTLVEIIEDVEPPEINCPANDLEVTLLEGVVYPLPDYGEALNVTDFCSDDLTIIQDPEEGVRLGFGVHDIALTATDEVGNESSCEFTLQILRAITPDNNQNAALNALELVSLAPNPSDGKVTLNNPLELKIETIEIRDMLGRYVNIIAINNSEKENIISVESLASGTYFVTINIPLAKKVIRLVKK